MPAKSPLETRFWTKVARSGPDDCWLWVGATMSGGYGKVKSDDGLIGAHRASWILANGPIPDGLCVLHACDNPPCVNPAHLWVGTHAENAADKVAKGRARGGPPLLTHCRRGHEFTAENIYWFKQATGQPGRRCRICAKEANRRWRRGH